MARKLLGDDSPCPHGDYVGQRMAAVPAQYLLNYWEEKGNDGYDSICNYIYHHIDEIRDRVKKEN